MSSKLKFCTLTNSNIQNSMVRFTFSVSDPKYPFLAKFGSKNQNCQLKMKFGTLTNSNMFNESVHGSPFSPEIHLLGKFNLKNQNCHFKLKFGT